MKRINSLVVRYAFLIFSISGICVVGYLIYEIAYPRKEWEIKVVGQLKANQRQEVEETVRYFVQLNKNQVNERALKEILQLNPRVAEVTDITISSRKQIVIQLKFKETAYVYHNPKNYQLQEISFMNEVLEAQINNFHEIDKEIPILCLTDCPSYKVSRHCSGDARVYDKMKRDIISILQKTKLNYGFVWEYISEICLGVSPYRYTIYSSHTRSRIQTNNQFDLALVRRLWALFYYLERKFKTKSTEVRLNRYNAHIKINAFF